MQIPSINQTSLADNLGPELQDAGKNELAINPGANVWEATIVKNRYPPTPPEYNTT